MHIIFSAQKDHFMGILWKKTGRTYFVLAITHKNIR